MQFCNFTKIGLQHGRFPVNVWKILGTAFNRKLLNDCVLELNFPVQQTKIIKVIIQLTISGFFRTHFLSVLFNCPYITDYLFVFFYFVYLFIYSSFILYCEFTHCPIKTLQHSQSLQFLRSRITLCQNRMFLRYFELFNNPQQYSKPKSNRF